MKQCANDNQHDLPSTLIFLGGVLGIDLKVGESELVGVCNSAAVVASAMVEWEVSPSLVGLPPLHPSPSPSALLYPDQQIQYSNLMDTLTGRAVSSHSTPPPKLPPFAFPSQDKLSTSSPLHFPKCRLSMSALWGIVFSYRPFSWPSSRNPSSRRAAVIV